MLAFCFEVCQLNVQQSRTQGHRNITEEDAWLESQSITSDASLVGRI